jgi:Secretion system C-terminal sorting domain
MSIRYIYSILLSFFIYHAEASIYCPPNKTLYCNDDIHNLQVTGKATVTNYHSSFVRYHDISYLNQCNIGTIQRIWYIDINQDRQYQSTESSCSQTLTLLGVEGQININFPSDKTYQCKEEIANDKPTWTSGSCDVIGYHVDDTVFGVATDACYKIYRKFTVINWCTHDPQSTTGYGKWTHTQIIKVVENTPPTITDCTNKIIGVESDCKTTFTIKNSAYDDTKCPSQLLNWAVEIDLWADGTTDYRYGLNEPGVYKLGPVANNQVVDITLPERVGVGKHKVYWSVKDQCGNFRTCNTLVETKDIKKPTPYLHDFLTSAFEGNVMDLVVHAKTFNVGSFDNCTPSSKLKYSFSANANDTIRIIDCANAGFQFFNIYVTDLQGNHEIVDVYMLIFDNGSCSVPSGISGRISESNSLPIENAHFSLSREGMEPLISTSDIHGSFNWVDISMYSDYQVLPGLTSYHPERTDIADLKKLQRYIMGLDQLINFEYAAADLDGDSKIRISDLELLKTKILNPSDTGASNWRMAAEMDTIRNINDLKNMADVFDIKRYDGNIDFKAIYKGNISGANHLETEPRSVTKLFQKKLENEMAFYLPEGLEISGLQIELLLSEAEDGIDIQSPYFNLSGPSLLINAGHPSIRFISLENFVASKDQPLFVIKTKNDINDIVLSPFSKILLNGDQISKLVIDQMSEFSNDYQIYPNPGADIFRFDDPSTKIETITDMTGKSIPFTQNNGEFTIQAPSGTYLVKTNHQGLQTTKKIIIK